MPKPNFGQVRQLNDEAKSAMQAGDRALAVRKVNEAIALNKNHVYSHNNYGNILLHFNDSGSAKGVFNHVLKLNPGDSYALQKLGQIDKRSGKKPQALAKYQLKHQAVSIRKGGSAAVVRHDGSAAAIYHKPDGTFGLAALRPCSGANGAGLFGVRSEVRTRVSADGRSIHIDHEVETRFRDMSLSDQSYLQLMP